MLTDTDIQKIIKANRETFSTKEDFVEIKEDIKELKGGMDGLRESVQSLVLSTDKLIKSMTDIHEEFISTVSKIDQQEAWIHQLAEKIGVKLKY
jgi:uncharacterized coiled-coil DUF342 family protein